MIIDYDDLENNPISATIALRREMLAGVDALEDYILSRTVRESVTAYEVLGGAFAQPPDPSPPVGQPDPSLAQHIAQQSK
jgi:hypothetical protein